MWKSQTYKRMREANPGEFEPKTIFFFSSEDVNEVDWNNCYGLKAATVYTAITGKDVDTKTMSIASKLLMLIAWNCYSLENPEKVKAQPLITTPQPNKKKGDIPELKRLEEILGAKGNEYRLKELVDGVYLAVGFLPGLKGAIGNWDREKANDNYLSNHNKDIIADVIKIENQLSLDIITETVLIHVDNAIETSKNFLFDNEVINDADPLRKTKYRCQFNNANFHEAIYAFCWYYSPFYSEKHTPTPDFKEKVCEKKHLLDCLHFSIMNPKKLTEEVSSTVWRIPSAKQLKRSGVKFQAQSDCYVDVAFSGPTFRLPALMYDFKLETVTRNLLAWESLNVQDQKPVTRYFQFLNELVTEIADVKVMKKFGVLRGSWKNFREVFELVKRIDGYASYPSGYFALDMEIKKAREFYDERMKIFLVRHKPTVVWVSSVAAASVLLTAVFARSRRSR